MQAASPVDNMISKESADLLLEGRGLACMKNETVLFSDLDLGLSSGEILQIDGANGSGKTSLIRILCGLALAERGEVRWLGNDIQTHRSEYLQDLAYVAHANGIKIDLTALENLAFAKALCVDKSGLTGEETLSFLGLAAYAELPAAHMSSGQRRRLALARLLTCSARLWILDEPLTSLDDVGKQLVRDIIIKHVESGGSVIVTTHERIDWLDCKVLRLAL